MQIIAYNHYTLVLLYIALQGYKYYRYFLLPIIILIKFPTRTRNKHRHMWEHDIPLPSVTSRSPNRRPDWSIVTWSTSCQLSANHIPPMRESFSCEDAVPENVLVFLGYMCDLLDWWNHTWVIGCITLLLLHGGTEKLLLF